MVKTFASEEKKFGAEEYKIRVETEGGVVIPIKAVAVPKICEKFGSQIVQTTIKGDVHTF